MNRLTICVLLLIVACHAVAPRGDEMRIALHARATTAPTTIVFDVINAGRTTASLDLCQGHIAPYIEIFQSGSWAQVLVPTCSFPIAPSVLLAPGQSVSDSVRFDTPGVFRLRVGYGRPPSRVLYLAFSDSVILH